ncbi:hypothetical protein DFJ74DRAFT_762693 [Hyaloraphidium curvatum]|nr:hypothetical protein DFJ74DRAFT_762693 [Hyaloraphidium curvatum]
MASHAAADKAANARKDESAPLVEHGDHRAPLFEDRDVDVFDTYLKIKTYYFPTATSKKIEFSAIERIETVEEAGVDSMGLKNWGMGLSDIWWSCDMDRGIGVQFGGLPAGMTGVVVTVRGDSIRKGFTTNRWPELRSVLGGIPALRGAFER